MLTIEVTKREMIVNGEILQTAWALYMFDGAAENFTGVQNNIAVPISQEKAHEISTLYTTTEIPGSADSGKTTYRVNIF